MGGSQCHFPIKIDNIKLFQSCFCKTFLSRSSYTSLARKFNQAVFDIRHQQGRYTALPTTMQLSDMTKSMIGLRSLSFKSAKE